MPSKFSILVSSTLPIAPCCPAIRVPGEQADRRTRTPGRAPSFPPTRAFAVAAFLLGVGSFGWANGARADALPADFALGRGGQLIARTEGASTILTVEAGRHAPARWELSFALDEVQVEPIRVGASALFVVRGERSGGARERIAALVTLAPTPDFLWRGRLDWHGDPGERVADVLEVRASGTGSSPTIVVGVRREGVGGCGEEPMLLSPRALRAPEPRGGSAASRAWRFEPIGAEAGLDASQLEGAIPLEAIAWTNPTRARLGALHFVAASSETARHEEGDRTMDPPLEAALLGPPAGLTDGNLHTGWSAPGAGRGALLRARYSGPPIVGIGLITAGPRRLPRRLLLRLDDARFLVSVPEALGDAARITLPSEVQASCVSLTIVEGHSAADPSGATRNGFADVAAFSIADEADGIERLVERLIVDGGDGDRVASWLASSGPRTLAVLDAAWERLGTRGRARALRVVEALERSASGEASDELRRDARAFRVRALESEDDEVRALAATSLARGEDEDRLALFDVAAGRGAPAATAVEAIAASEGVPEAARERLGGLDRDVFDRPALRAALASALARFESWQRSVERGELGGYAMAALAFAASSARDPDASVVRLLVTRAVDTEDGQRDFATRYRIASAAQVDPSAIRPWLEEAARGADEWMLRARALESLGALATPALLAEALRDPSPRIRLAAARVLAARDDGGATLRTLARRDPWPLVRAYALGELVDSDEGRALAIEALGDPLSAMRSAALVLLRTRARPDVDPALEAILEDDEEWPHVTARAIEVAEARCTEGLGPGLVQVVRRGARDRSSAIQLENAQQALRVALRVGGSTAEAARAATRGPSAHLFEILLTHPQPPCAGATDDIRGFQANRDSGSVR